VLLANAGVRWLSLCGVLAAGYGGADGVRLGPGIVVDGPGRAGNGGSRIKAQPSAAP